VQVIYRPRSAIGQRSPCENRSPAEERGENLAKEIDSKRRKVSRRDGNLSWANGKGVTKEELCPDGLLGVP